MRTRSGVSGGQGSFWSAAWIARVASVSGLSVFFARAVGFLWEGARSGAGKWATIFAGLAVLTWLNVRGVKSGARAAVVGLRDVDQAERTKIKASGIGAFTMRDIDERGMRAVMEEAIKRASSGTAGIHVSFDLDGMDPDLAPGVGTPSPGGFSYREAHLAMEMLADTGKVVGIDLVEVNPVLDTHNRTAGVATDLLLSALGKRIL